MIPAGTDRTYTNYDKMAARYGVDRTTAATWSREKAFPEILYAAGQGGLQIYDEDDVDDWVREHHFGSWTQSQRDKKNPLNLPGGNPRDLLSLRRIGELEGRALNRQPTPIGTLRTYLSPSKGILPPADRTPDDDLQPKVTEPMWFRETAYTYISRPRRTRRTASSDNSQSAREPSAKQPISDDALLDLDLPAGDDTDLLTLQQIGELDGKARGRSKATTLGTLKNYQSQQLLAKPDRTPGDGLEPAVEEPMWRRATAYRFIRRPGRLGAAARASRESAQAPQDLREDLKLPKGADTDLLTLQQIGVIDGKARGRSKATTVSSMRTYRYGSRLLAEPDRTPGDGLEPAVEEPMWRRATAYRFIRRPGTVGGAR